jgi:broad specificity phosphatase PhoE
MSERLYLLRHSYDDHSCIDGNNDTCLTREGIDIARKMAVNMTGLLLEDEGRVVNVHTSCKKRSVETAEILSEQLDRSSVLYTFHIDDNLRELYQGRIINIDRFSHQEKIGLLQLAWEMFDSRRVGNDMNYHFGDPGNGSGQNPLLRGFIECPYGESQNEFSFRIGDALDGLLQGLRNDGGLPVVITHRGGIREMQNLIYAINNNIPVGQSQVCEMSGLRYCEIIPAEIKDTGLCIDAIDGYLKRIKTGMK